MVNSAAHFFVWSCRSVLAVVCGQRIRLQVGQGSDLAVDRREIRPSRVEQLLEIVDHEIGLLKIVDAVRYASAYSFKYSPRPGTPAAVMEDQIPREIMDDRLQRLQARITEHSLAFNRSKVGVDTQLLIERKGRLPGQMIGRSPWLQSVHVETGAAPGDIIDVTMVAAGPNSMAGAVLQRVAA